MITFPIKKILRDKLKIPNVLAALLPLLTIIFTGGLIIKIIGEKIIRFFSNLSSNMPYLKSQLLYYSDMITSKIVESSKLFPNEVNDLITSGFKNIIALLTSALEFFINKTINILTVVPQIPIYMIIIIISSYFMTVDREIIRDVLKKPLEKYLLNNVHYIRLKKDVFKVVLGYLKAQAILMSITMAISLIGLTIIGQSNALPIAIGIGIFDAVPLFGPAAIYMPWIIITLISGSKIMAMKLFIIYICTTLARQILEPKILGTQIGIHPLVTLLSLFTGIKLLGMPGIIIGPLVAITVTTYYKSIYSSEKHEH
jgi:sporulation integral membrane protein YtvI